MQKNLKVLNLMNLWDSLMFETDKLSNDIKFSLHELNLYAVYWRDNEKAMNFFKTQTSLKKVTLYFENYKGI